MKTIQKTLQLLAGMLFLFSTTASLILAREYEPYPGISVEVVSDERGCLNKYPAMDGKKYAQRNYVIARDNERYRIRVRNRSKERIGLVIAVDGRNIISGDKSYLGPQERMYILGPYETGEYEGWRTGRNRTNRFYFTGMSDSYAAAWGDYSAMGVIAVAAYQSRHRGLYWNKGEKRNRPLEGPGANSRRQDPGTGFGEAEWSPSITVKFAPQDRAFAREFIKYEWRSTLCKRGVIRCRDKKFYNGGNRFWPETEYDDGFAPHPGLIPWSGR